MIDRCYLEITDVCNLQCVFCPKTKRAPKTMSHQEFDTLTDRLKGQVRFLYFHLMGEPLLNPCLPQFIEEARAKAALEKIEKDNYGPCGPYLSAVERDRMMTIATSVQAMAEARYGRIDKIVECLKLMTNCMNKVMPGTITEMLPDYGCTFQAWTIYGFAKGMIGGCFGIQPRADQNCVTIQPVLPSGWDTMSVKHVKVGNNAIDLTVSVEGHGTKVIYRSEKPGLKAVIQVGGETKEIESQTAEIVFGK